MKNLVKIGLLSIVLLTTAVAKASKKVNVTILRSKVLNITLSEVKEGEILSILDINGVKLYQKALSKTELYTKKFDFSTAPNGVYFIEIREVGLIKVTPLLIDSNNNLLLTSSTKEYKAPSIHFDGIMAKILVKNFNQVPVTISVLDYKGEVLSISENNTNLVIYTNFNFSELSSGDYTIKVKEGDYVFTKEISFK